MLTKELIEQMDEDRLRIEVVIPLLRAMGYKDVTDHHGGPLEQGKDVVCWRTDNLGDRENLAVVIKAVAITGRAAIGKGTAGEVQTQIQQCFGEPFLDPVTGEQRRVHQCWVVSNQPIAKGAERAIASALSSTGLDRNVKFVSSDKLWERVQEHLPVQAVWQKLEEANQVLDSIDTHYRPQVQLSSRGIEITVGEKFPGASQEKPFTINAAFVFPNTPEGQAVREAVERHFATGAPVEIPAPFIQSFEFPEFFQKLSGAGDPKARFLRLGPIRNEGQLYCRIEFYCDDGDDFVLEHVRLKLSQAGEEEVTLSSEEQPIPIQTVLVLRPNAQTASLSFRFRRSPMNVYLALQVLRLRTCLAKPARVRVIQLDTGIPIIEMRQDIGTGEAPDPRLIEATSDLLAVQMKVKRPITIPDREITEDEIRTIGRLRAILHSGRLIGRWTGVSANFTADDARRIVDDFGEGSRPVFLEAEETEELFGAMLPLGAVRFTYEQAKLANEADVRERLSELAGNQPLVTLEFSPTENDQVVKEYSNWQEGAAAPVSEPPSPGLDSVTASTLSPSTSHVDIARLPTGLGNEE